MTTTILGSRIKPAKERLAHERICRRCGIEWEGKGQTPYCRDCRDVLRVKA